MNKEELLHLAVATTAEVRLQPTSTKELEIILSALNQAVQRERENKRVYAQIWRNDAIEAAAKIVKRYDGNPHCIADILALMSPSAIRKEPS